MADISEQPETLRDLYFKSKAFDDDRHQEQLMYELYLNKVVPPNNSVSCPNCGLTNVKIEKTQKSRADEGGSAIGTCNQCGNRFIVN